MADFKDFVEGTEVLVLTGYQNLLQKTQTEDDNRGPKCSGVKWAQIYADSELHLKERSLVEPPSVYPGRFPPETGSGGAISSPAAAGQRRNAGRHIFSRSRRQGNGC